MLYRLLRSIEGGVVIQLTVLVAVLAREQAGTAWPRDGVGHIGISEDHPIVGNAIEIGRLDMTVVVATHHLPRVIVGHDVNNVQRFFICRSPATGTGGEQRHTRHGINNI